MSTAHPRRPGRRFAWQVAVAAFSGLLGCAAEEGGGDGNGSGGPTDLQSLDTAAPTIVRELNDGDERLRYNPSQFDVRKDLTLVFSTRTPDGGFDGFNGEIVDGVRDAIYTFDYGTGVSRELVRIPLEGRLGGPVPAWVDRGLVYYPTIAEDAETMRVRGLDPVSGALTSDTVLSSFFGNCFVVASGDLYFDEGGLSLLAARDFIGRDSVTGFDTIGGGELCLRSEDLASLDGTAVLVEAPNPFEPPVDTIRVTALDPGTGVPESTPVLSVPVSSVSLGTAGEREPTLSVEEDGLYVLASDFVALEVWFVPYDRRPGEAPSADSEATPERLARIEVPFFAEVIPTSGDLAILDPSGFQAVDGTVALTVVIEERAGDGRFFWGFLVMIDTQTARFDLLLFSNATGGLVDMIPTAP